MMDAEITTAKESSRKTIFLCVAAIMLWILSIGSTYTILLKYEKLPGPKDNAPKVFPAKSKLVPKPGYYTLVMFAHPKCPCTMASLNELSKITSRSRLLDANIFFLSHPDSNKAWTNTESWQRAMNIPGIAVRKDPGGKEASLFGACSSGQTLLYAPDGKLVFEGGITAGRGHQGDNQGMQIILADINNEIVKTRSTPVFGCRLKDEKHAFHRDLKQCLH